MTNDQIQSAITANVDSATEYIYQAASHARGIFANAGCPEDFCIQHFGCTTIVFGGRNRLLWTATHGFRPDREYCDEKFLARFESGLASS